MGSSIEGLPVELLVNILLESQIPRISKDHGPFATVIEEHQRPVTNWVPLMLVCRCFRDVILAAPTLWSRIHVTNDLAALQCNLSRFGSSPLDLLFDAAWESVLPLIQPHASRIRAIITTPRFHIYALRCLLPLLSLPLPALEHVHIVPDLNLSPDSEEWQKLTDAGSVLNETSHPRVKILTSYRLLLPPQESRFWCQKLVHLDIRCQGGGRITTEHRDDLLAVLRTTRRLESLAITFPDAPPPDAGVQILHGAQAREPTPLLRLRRLTLSGPTWLSGPVLHGIDTPSLERVYLRITVFRQQNGEDAIAGIFPRRLLRVLVQHTRLHIHASPGRHGFRMGDCYCEAGRVTSDRFSLHVRVEGAWWETTAHLHTALHLLCRVFEDARLETLEVNYFLGQPPEVDGVWRNVLETFSGLRKLTLFGNDRKSGAAMVDAIETLRREGLNPGMELVAKNTDWGT
ncbi:hypothetical protein LXA43DRAFT_727048 [Ganoderma leucocontextum]|nr:hypothetical protein LXA43DRAFT_727048 [Ganoderma leucocontextum]